VKLYKDVMNGTFLNLDLFEKLFHNKDEGTQKSISANSTILRGSRVPWWPGR
jgi:hypothetical protein